MLECENCNKAIHTKCYKNAKFCCIDELWLCQTCTENSEPRYNPFPKNLTQDSSDKFYDEIEPQANDPAIKAITKVLGNCKSYTAQEFKLSQSNIPKQIVTSSQNSKSLPIQMASSLFLNIDGNKSNFDQFLVEIKRINHDFSVIGIAETNTDKPLKDLYSIPKYTRHYQDTIEGKSKGTGIGLYVLDSINTELMDTISQ